LFPQLSPEPAVSVPEPYASETVTRESALLEIVRGRLQMLGPVTAAQLAASIRVPVSDIDIALPGLEQEGFVLRGKFTALAYASAQDPNAPAIEEWCERGLLARIHRYTLNRLRAEIEPVSTRDLMRFLFSWQHVIAGERKEGSDALAVVLADLEGFEAPASAWEAEILPARMRNYQYNWLDDLCLAGRTGWARLAKPKSTEGAMRRAGPVRSTPIALVARKHRGIWQLAANGDSEAPAMSSRAQAVHDMLREHGASFFDEIVDTVRLLPSEAEEALAELVAIGAVTSDSFAGIRALLVPLDKRKSFSGAKRRHRTVAFGIQDAGRWSVARVQQADKDEMVEYVTRALLRRYGVVFWRLLAREADWLPPWRDILRVLRRLEARGEIRGGRFVAGITGEQYALPEALTALRNLRKQPAQESLISLSAADPLNLVGVILPGSKVPALTGNRILYRDGVAVATLIADTVNYLGEFSTTEQNAFKTALVQRSLTSPQLNYLR
jgi:ATP-dependent Lhr-like helicase